MFFVLPSNLLFASSSSPELKKLVTVIPIEVYFSDNDLTSSVSPSTFNLAPIAPSEADFNDSDVDNLNLILNDFVPQTPAEADFSDSETTVETISDCLAPIIPAEASFEEIGTANGSIAFKKLFSKRGCSPKTFLKVRSFLGSR